MVTHDFPGCCVATILSGFGVVDNAQIIHHNHPDTEEELEEWVKKKVAFYKQTGYAVLVAIINNQQEFGKKVLRAHGFKFTKSMKSLNHRDTTTQLCWKVLQD